MTTGKIIQTIRKEKGYTQKQLAEKCGLATGTIQQYELNKREPRQKQLRKIAEVLNVPPSYLIGWRDKDWEIESKIDNLIVHLRDTNLSQTEISKTIRKIENLVKNQKELEEKMRDIDSKNMNPKFLLESFDSNEFSESELKEIRDFAEFIKTRRATDPPQD